MRKIKLDKDTVITANVVDWIIKKHSSEKARIGKLNKYYRNDNDIVNRVYEDPLKPQNRISHPFASYITNMAVGYFLGKPIAYKSDNEDLLFKLQETYDYNDEADNNTTLAKYASIGGYAYELMYVDEDARVRFKALSGDDMCVVYDNTVEENILLAVRYYDVEEPSTDKIVTMIEVYEKHEISYYKLEDETLSKLPETNENVFNDIPVAVYINNDELYGDFEKVKPLIDAYDKAQTDTANDFEYFTNALLVISGIMVEQDNLNFKDNRVINFSGTEGKAEYLIKNINDSALENYKNRLVEDIHKFSQIPNLTDEKFGGNVSGEAMKYKLMGLENITGVKEAKFKKGLMRRIELICNYLKIFNSDFLFTDIEPVFTRNRPQNEKELSEMVKGLYGIVSNQTLLSLLPFVNDVQSEIEAIEADKADTIDYAFSNEGDVVEE